MFTNFKPKVSRNALKDFFDQHLRLMITQRGLLPVIIDPMHIEVKRIKRGKFGDGSNSARVNNAQTASS